MATTVVFSGGPVPPLLLSGALASGVTDSGVPEVIVAADSGLEACFAAGFEPDIVVGDMDSVDPAALEHAAASGARIDRHPADKDSVDLELALDAAIEFAPPGGPGDRLVVIGSAAGRLDHLIASILLLGSVRYHGFEITAVLGAQRVVPVHSVRTFTEPVGTTVSLLAMHGAGSRVTTSGLQWALADQEIRPSSSLGISNRFAESTATVTVAGPPVTVVLPDELIPGDIPAPEPRHAGPLNPAPGGGAP